MTALTFSPSRARPSVVLLMAGAALLVVLGLTGITQRLAFEEPSTLKYALTVAGPLFLMVAVTAERPLLLIAATIVVAAPFAGFQATVSTYDIPLLWPLLAMAIVALAFEDREPGSTPLAWAGIGAVPLLLVPIANGLDTGDFIQTLLTLLVVAWVVYRACQTPEGLPIVIGALIASATVQSVIAIWEYKTGSKLNLYGGAGTDVFGKQYFYAFENANRPIRSLYDPISLGNVLAIAGPLLVVAGLRTRGALRWAVGGAAVLIALALALSLSRMSWIGFVVGIALSIVLLPRRQRRQAAMVSLLGVVVVVGLALTVGGSSLRERFSTLQNPTSKQYSTGSGDERRLAIWDAALQVFAEHPAEGVGVGRLANQIQRRVANVGTYTHAHSVYFQLVAEAGVLGIALLVTFLVGIWSSVRTALRRDPVIGAGMAGAAVALLICWTTDWVIIYANVAASVAVLLGLLAAVGRTPTQRSPA
jgi:O-antigen ligase